MNACWRGLRPTERGCGAPGALGPANEKSRRLVKGAGFSEKAAGEAAAFAAMAAGNYCAAGNPWIFIPGLMPFDVNQPLLISNTYTPLFFGQ